ncbi:unnamed protein product, partial [Choristocarpus tenellus]
VLSEPFDDITTALLKRQGMRRLIGFMGVSAKDVGSGRPGVEPSRTPPKPVLPMDSPLPGKPQETPPSLSASTASRSRHKLQATSSKADINQPLGRSIAHTRLSQNAFTPPPAPHAILADHDGFHHSNIDLEEWCRVRMAQQGWGGGTNPPSSAATSTATESFTDISRGPSSREIRGNVSRNLHLRGTSYGGGSSSFHLPHSHGSRSFIQAVTGSETRTSQSRRRDMDRQSVIKTNAAQGALRGYVKGVELPAAPVASSASKKMRPVTLLLQTGSQSQYLKKANEEIGVPSTAGVQMKEEVLRAHEVMLEREGALAGHEAEVDMLKVELKAMEGELRRVRTELATSEASNRQVRNG